MHCATRSCFVLSVYDKPLSPQESNSNPWTILQFLIFFVTWQRRVEQSVQAVLMLAEILESNISSSCHLPIKLFVLIDDTIYQICCLVFCPPCEIDIFFRLSSVADPHPHKCIQGSAMQVTAQKAIVGETLSSYSMVMNLVAILHGNRSFAISFFLDKFCIILSARNSYL